MAFYDNEHADHLHATGFDEHNDPVAISNPDDFYDRLDRRLNGENEGSGRGRGNIQRNGVSDPWCFWLAKVG
jgi:hypothetical protein